MLIKPLQVSTELKILRSLNIRMQLSSSEKQYYTNLEKGYEGEKKFEAILLESKLNDFIVSDLLLEKNNSSYQIDSLLISQKTIYLFEIKNFAGDYYIEMDAWYSKSGSEIKNPFDQLKRNESLLRRLLHDFSLSSTITVEPYLLFINPEFTLYQAPLHLPAIFPTQLNRFIDKLKIQSKSSKLNRTYQKLAEQLVSLHLVKPRISRIPEYKFDHPKKGIICGSCCSSISVIIENKVICHVCGYRESVDSTILRSVEEFVLLFPDRKITTNDIFEWCQVIESKKTIRRVLKKNFHYIKQARFSYFIPRNDS
ncbi:nuclease-related domain-containing protein [Niallia endozanthoxylica]|uniref:NERD domain-containing protein n=1 Tax=Niallia endozanthoxylica TaxID=2036016 RepID=A0A5J5H259_9BACI|nr:nuclease-related domain-containing protein [Niallia endozanthoxylica]KAA9014048.1 NERD domain-containing protein [Niallia endozanthoxylica]